MGRVMPIPIPIPIPYPFLAYPSHTHFFPIFHIHTHYKHDGFGADFSGSSITPIPIEHLELEEDRLENHVRYRISIWMTSLICIEYSKKIAAPL